MLPSDMNLWIGNIRNYNNKILISSPSFKIGTNVKINLLSSENRRLNDDVKSKKVDNQRLMVKTEPDVKPKVITKPNVKPNKEHKQDIHWALLSNIVRREPNINLTSSSIEKANPTLMRKKR